jgi:hypothetical protein
MNKIVLLCVLFLFSGCDYEVLTVEEQNIKEELSKAKIYCGLLYSELSDTRVIPGIDERQYKCKKEDKWLNIKNIQLKTAFIKSNQK